MTSYIGKVTPPRCRAVPTGNIIVLSSLSRRFVRTLPAYEPACRTSNDSNEEEGMRGLIIADSQLMAGRSFFGKLRPPISKELKAFKPGRLASRKAI